MSVGGIDLSGFQNNEAVSQQFDDTSGKDQVQSRLITTSGTYVMEVSTFCFRNKKRNNEVIISPTLAKSSKGGINLVASMQVCKGFGTSQVSEGDYITVNVPVWPSPKATKDDVSNMFKLSKPRLCALLGVDNFKLELDNVVDKFSTEWSENEDGSFELKKDHALKGRVVCTFDDSVYNNRPTLNLVNMRRFKEGDKSVSNGPAEQAPQNGFGSSQSDSSPEEQEELNFSSAGETASSGQAPQQETPETAQDVITPDTVQEDTLPF